MTYLWITLRETGGVAMVSDEAHREVWEPRGWQPVAIDYAAATAAFGAPVVRPDQLTETYVRELVAVQKAAADTPAPEPVETTTSARRAGRKTGEENA